MPNFFRAHPESRVPQGPGRAVIQGPTTPRATKASLPTSCSTAKFYSKATFRPVACLLYYTTSTALWLPSLFVATTINNRRRRRLKLLQPSPSPLEAGAPIAPIPRLLPTPARARPRGDCPAEFSRTALAAARGRGIRRSLTSFAVVGV